MKAINEYSERNCKFLSVSPSNISGNAPPSKGLSFNVEHLIVH